MVEIKLKDSKIGIRKLIWSNKIIGQIEKITKSIKDEKKAELFSYSAMRRLYLIEPYCIIPMKIVIQNYYLGKRPKEILESDFKPIRDATKLFPLRLNKQLVEEINDYVNRYEIELYKILIDPETHKKLTANHLMPIGAELGILYIDGITKRKNISDSEKEQAMRKFREKYLELLQEALKENPDVLNKPIGKIFIKGAKKGQIQSWPLIGPYIWDMYLLLLPLYMTPSRQPIIKRSRMFSIFPIQLRKIIVEILSTEIPALKDITIGDIKSRLQYMIQDKLKNPSDFRLLIMSASILSKIEIDEAGREQYDKAILLPYEKYIKPKNGAK